MASNTWYGWAESVLAKYTAADFCYDFLKDLIPKTLKQLKAFLAKVKGDTTLQEKLKAAKSPEDVASIAKEHGHEITVEKFNQLSEKELERIAGGFDCNFDACGSECYNSISL